MQLDNPLSCGIGIGNYPLSQGDGRGARELPDSLGQGWLLRGPWEQTPGGLTCPASPPHGPSAPGTSVPPSLLETGTLVHTSSAPLHSDNDRARGSSPQKKTQGGLGTPRATDVGVTPDRRILPPHPARMAFQSAPTILPYHAGLALPPRERQHTLRKPSKTSFIFSYLLKRSARDFSTEFRSARACSFSRTSCWTVWWETDFSLCSSSGGRHKEHNDGAHSFWTWSRGPAEALGAAQV